MLKNKLTRTHLRRDYHSAGIVEIKMQADPMREFAIWFQQATKKKITDANAFILATADRKARPSARVLLMKGFNPDGIIFFTNYKSDKGRQIAQNPYGEAVFFWNQINRQVRLRGRIVKLARNLSVEYFRTRPVMAQLAACISHQSHIISSRRELEQKFEALKKKFKNSVPDMPADWGGYQLKVNQIEFWQGRPNRLHDRVRYEKKLMQGWKKVRLQP